MFFDEYNNFVMMSKNYIMPSEQERLTDFALQGTKDFVNDAEVKNKTNKPKLYKYNFCFNTRKLCVQ